MYTKLVGEWIVRSIRYRLTLSIHRYVYVDVLCNAVIWAYMWPVHTVWPRYVWVLNMRVHMLMRTVIWVFFCMWIIIHFYFQVIFFFLVLRHTLRIDVFVQEVRMRCFALMPCVVEIKFGTRTSNSYACMRMFVELWGAHLFLSHSKSKLRLP